MSVISAVFLGLVQGVAEFLPISSSGHLAVLQNLFDFQTAEQGHMFFDVLLHLGTVIAIIAAYWKDIVEIVGDILRFGVGMSPSVRGVHFQPVTWLGRSPSGPADERRMTLDELIDALVKQSDGMLTPENLAPSRCDHPLCGFHGDFVAAGGQLKPLTHWTGDEKPCEATADQNREFVGRRWQRPEGECCCSPDMSTMDGFLDSVKHYGFTVTSMAFQDAGNFDIERLRSCSTHVYSDGRFIPLCAYYLSKEAKS